MARHGQTRSRPALPEVPAAVRHGWTAKRLQHFQRLGVHSVHPPGPGARVAVAVHEIGTAQASSDWMRRENALLPHMPHRADRTETAAFPPCDAEVFEPLLGFHGRDYAGESPLGTTIWQPGTCRSFESFVLC